MQAGVRICDPAGLSLLRDEWIRLGIAQHIECEDAAPLCPRLDGTARSWMPDFDTLGLAVSQKLEVHQCDDDLLREIWLTLLHSPFPVDFPNAAELLAMVRVRRNIARNAARTLLNFHTSAVERPSDCWRYSEETGFVLVPGSSLIESLRKACQPEPGGTWYSFSCYRATEYVVLLSIAEEARESHPALLRRLQEQWQRKAVASGRFHDVFMQEHGSLEEPVPMHYYVPGDRVWFRNPDTHSADVPGFEGSWVMYLGGGLFANFWKRDRHFDMLSKCLEIHHWRDSTFVDDKGGLQMDETKVERLMTATLTDPQATAAIYQRMHRLRDPQGVYAEGGCIDATRESPAFVLAPHSRIIAALDALKA